MADPNGKEAGIAFLEENKKKDGVITLPSGLQYKVLEEGGGLEHPKVDTECACHYAGRLLDGTQFDSSYDRGEPSTFAPNQVNNLHRLLFASRARGVLDELARLVG
eukprot:558660-Rhodomonas_salina.2